MVDHTPFLATGAEGVRGDGDCELGDGEAPVISHLPRDQDGAVGLLSCVH